MPARMDPRSNARILHQLKRYLTETRKRQYELAAEIGAPPQTVNRWLTGDTTVSKAYYNLMRVKGILRGRSGGDVFAMKMKPAHAKEGQPWT